MINSMICTLISVIINLIILFGISRENYKKVFMENNIPIDHQNPGLRYIILEMKQEMMRRNSRCNRCLKIRIYLRIPINTSQDQVIIDQFRLNQMGDILFPSLRIQAAMDFAKKKDLLRDVNYKLNSFIFYINFIYFRSLYLR